MSKWGRIEDEGAYKISEESAEKLVREVLDFYEIDPSRSDREQEKVLEESLNDLQKAYRRGALENKLDDVKGFCIIQHLKNGDTLTYREMKGKDRVVMDGFDNSKAFARTNAILGKLCGYGEDAITKLSGRDWETARTLALVFFMNA